VELKMKRLNPETGKEFKRGDYREDGYTFKGYKKELKVNGYFSECWVRPGYKAVQGKLDKLRRTKPEARAKMLLSAAKSRSKEKGSECSITESWVLEKLKTGCCELTGLSFDLSSTSRVRKNPFSPSLDRVNSLDLNYSPENTRVVLTAVNESLNQHGEDTMLPILKAMVAAIEAKHG
jgi:hypothetical protein